MGKHAMIKAPHIAQPTDNPPKMAQTCPPTADPNKISGGDLVSVSPPDNPGLLGAFKLAGSSTLGATSGYIQVRNTLHYNDEPS